MRITWNLLQRSIEALHSACFHLRPSAADADRGVCADWRAHDSTIGVIDALSWWLPSSAGALQERFGFGL
jgi:hypothetical protein